METNEDKTKKTEDARVKRNAAQRDYYQRHRDDPGFREARREYQRNYLKRKREEDPEFITRLNAAQVARRKERVATEPGYRERLQVLIDRGRKKRAYRIKNEPGYRKKLTDSAREYQRRKKAADPEYAERYKQRMRDYRAKKKAERAAARAAKA